MCVLSSFLCICMKEFRCRGDGKFTGVLLQVCTHAWIPQALVPMGFEYSYLYVSKVLMMYEYYAAIANISADTPLP